jgi:hypothetical protein
MMSTTQAERSDIRKRHLTVLMVCALGLASSAYAAPALGEGELGGLPPATPKVRRPTTAELKKALKNKTWVMAAEFRYKILDHKPYRGADEPSNEACKTSYGASGLQKKSTADTDTATFVSCFERTRYRLPATSKANWMSIDKKRSNIPKQLEITDDDLKPFSANHLLIAAKVNPNGKEGDDYDIALFAAHKSGSTIVLDAVWSFHTIWVH